MNATHAVTHPCRAMSLLGAATLAVVALLAPTRADAATLLGDTIFGGVGANASYAIPGPGQFTSNTAVVGPGIEFTGQYSTISKWYADFSGTESNLLTISMENIYSSAVAQINLVWAFSNLDFGPVPQDIVGVTMLNSTFTHTNTAISFTNISADGQNSIIITQSNPSPVTLPSGGKPEATFAITLAPIPEPTSLALLGGAGVITLRRRRA